MPTNLIPGSEIFAFGPIELHGKLQSISDARGFRLVSHEFLKRDGGLVEVMGRRPHQAEIEIHFVGPSFRADLTAFLAMLDENPKRLLVHPLLGQYLAACTVPRGALDVIQATSAYKLTASFTESALDARTEEAPTVQGARQKVFTLAASLTTEAAGFASAVPIVALLADAATSYADAGATSYETATADPTLGSQLDNVAARTSTASAALLADPATTTDARAYPALSLAEQVYAACLELDEALQISQPLAVDYVVTAATTLAPLLQALYGSRALDYLDALLALNRSITTRALIPAGTRLTLPAAPTGDA